jgi:hypothetical protein
MRSVIVTLAFILLLLYVALFAAPAPLSLPATSTVAPWPRVPPLRSRDANRGVPLANTDQVTGKRILPDATISTAPWRAVRARYS